LLSPSFFHLLALYCNYQGGSVSTIIGTEGALGDGQEVELFYNIAVTPWSNLTPDLQVIVPTQEEVDTSVVVGVRDKAVF
jgi:carbohydrate-selective porin OprB